MKTGIVRIGRLALLAVAGPILLATSAFAQQASITLSNCSGEDCIVHQNKWTIDKSVKTNSVVDGVGTVTWTVTATKTSGGTTYSVHGGLTVKNTGSAPATIGNIVVNLQKTNSPKQGSNASHVSIAADVADATNGDLATQARIVAGGSQENAATNAAWGTNNYTVSGVQGKFIETACSGALEFKDASNNTIFSLIPQPTIPVGDSITLLYDATFQVGCLPATGAQLRVEAMVTFGNAGQRGGGGSVGNNIDVNGNGSLGADEANVRTVPCRSTLGALEAVEEANASVTVSDPGATVEGTVTTSNPLGFGAFPAIVSNTTSWDVSVDVNSGTEGGRVCNAASLLGEAIGGDLDTIVGYQKDELGNLILDPVTGQPIPIHATYECAGAASGSDESCVPIGPPTGFLDGQFCTYSKGGYHGGGAPGDLLVAQFGIVFPSGLTIGFNDAAGPLHHAQWTVLTTLKGWIGGGGGSSGALTADTLNATSTSGGTLARHVAALAINIALSGNGNPPGFGGLVLAKTGKSLDGSTVVQILDAANNALSGGGLPSGYTFGDLNNLIDLLNLAFDNCEPTQWAQDHLS